MKHLISCLAVFAATLVISRSGGAAEPGSISLPKPRTAGGRPLMQVLKERKTTREIGAEKLSSQQLSELLWAAFGINRPESAHRTAPSAMNSQEIDIYVALAEGLHLYEPQAHLLRRISDEDVRPRIGTQPFVQQAPVALVFVADLPRMVKAKPEDRPMYAGIDTGFISQNVYLYCASEGLATVVHEISNRAKLAEALRLRPDQKIILGQAVGHPARQ